MSLVPDVDIGQFEGRLEASFGRRIKFNRLKAVVDNHCLLILDLYYLLDPEVKFKNIIRLDLCCKGMIEVFELRNRARMNNSK